MNSLLEFAKSVIKSSQMWFEQEFPKIVPKLSCFIWILICYTIFEKMYIEIRSNWNFTWNCHCFHEFFLYDLLKSTEEIINVIFVINWKKILNVWLDFMNCEQEFPKIVPKLSGFIWIWIYNFFIIQFLKKCTLKLGQIETSLKLAHCFHEFFLFDLLELTEKNNKCHF